MALTEKTLMLLLVVIVVSLVALATGCNIATYAAYVIATLSATLFTPALILAVIILIQAGLDKLKKKQ